MLEGLVLVGITVETRETGRVEVTVPFAVGRPDRLAGMVVTTEPAPRGPTVIIDRWGEAIIAHCWRLLMDVVSTLCARVGVDTGGRPLLPGAIVASRGGLRVIPSVLTDEQVWTRRDTPTSWRDDPIEAATQFAYLPDTSHEAQEGYVRVRLDP